MATTTTWKKISGIAHYGIGHSPGAQPPTECSTAGDRPDGQVHASPQHSGTATAAFVSGRTSRPGSAPREVACAFGRLTASWMLRPRLICSPVESHHRIERVKHTREAET